MHNIPTGTRTLAHLAQQEDHNGCSTGIRAQMILWHVGKYHHFITLSFAQAQATRAPPGQPVMAGLVTYSSWGNLGAMSCREDTLPARK